MALTSDGVFSSPTFSLGGAQNVSPGTNGNYYWQATTSGKGVGLLSQSGSAYIIADGGVGSLFGFTASSYIKTDSANTIITAGNADGATSAALFVTVASTQSTAGSTGIVYNAGGGAYAHYGVVSGTTGIYANTVDRIADTAGTTAFRLVTATADNKVATAGATANLKTIVGVAIATKTAGQVCQVAYSGDVFVEYGGTVNRGDVLVSDDGTAGKVKANNTPTAGGIVGLALEDGGVTTSGQVRMLLRLN
jgi:hypothetical protein